jgi:hypothetical protein
MNAKSHCNSNCEQKMPPVRTTRTILEGGWRPDGHAMAIHRQLSPDTRLLWEENFQHEIRLRHFATDLASRVGLNAGCTNIPRRGDRFAAVPG